MANEAYVEVLEASVPVYVEGQAPTAMVEVLETDVPIIVELSVIGAGGSGGIPLVHTHVEGDVTNLTSDLAGKANTSHTHAESGVTNLVADLNAKANTAHTHAEGNITGLVTDLANKATALHTHAESDITNLVADLLARPPAGDTTPPTSPGSFASDPAQLTTTTAVLTWTASVDAVGVTGYRIYSYTIAGGGGGTPVITQVGSPGVNARSFQLSGLSAGIQYHYQATAVDAAGNESDPSDVIFATSPAPDATAPSVPTGLAVVTTLSTQIELLWNASTDTQSGVAGYRVYQGVGGATPDMSTPIRDVDTPTVTIISGLTAGTVYRFRVTAYDNAGNESGGSGIVPVTTKAGVSFVAAASGITTTSGPGGPSCTVPAGTQGGDVILIWGSLGSVLGSEPANYNTATSSPQSQSTGVSVFSWKIAPGAVGQASSDVGATVKYVTAGQKNVIYMQVWRSEEPSNPIAVSAVAAESTSRTVHTFPDMAVGLDGCVIVGALTMKDGPTNSTTITPPSGWTSTQGLVGTAGANQQDIYVASNGVVRPPSNLTGITFTGDQATATATMWLVALAPLGSTIDVTPPVQVTGFNVSNILVNKLTLVWTKSTSVDTVKYRIYRGTGNVLLTATTALVDVLGINSTAYTDTNLAANQQYTYCITALDASGNESVVSGAQRPTTLSTSSNPQIIYGLNCCNQANVTLKMAARSAANGWITDGTLAGVAAGQPLVDAAGNAINLGMSRNYYSGALPAAWEAGFANGGAGVNTNKRINVCFKTQYTFQQVSTGSADGQIMNYVNSIPVGWEVMFTFHHEPNNDWNTTSNTPAFYKAAWQRIGKLLQGTQAGQIAPAAKIRTNTKPDSTHVMIYSGVCYTIWPTSTANDAVRCLTSIPLASTMDPHAILVMDAYQNPPPPIAQAGRTPLYQNYTNGDTVDATPNMSSIWGYFFTSVLGVYGYDTGNHGYGVGEWMAPVRDGDNQTTFQGQADAVDRYLTYLENQTQTPYVILMWEDNTSTTDVSNATYLQWAHPKAKAAFTNHACGPYAV